MSDFTYESVDIALTGHRPAKLFGWDLNHPGYGRMQATLEALIRDALTQCRTVSIRSRMALGADTVWALAALAVADSLAESEKHRLKLIAHIPFESQPNAWATQADKDRWAYIRSRADEEFITYKGPVRSRDEAGRWLNQRNRDMIGPASHLIAIWDGQPRGGTANAVRDGKKVGKNIIHFHPSVFGDTGVKGR